MQSYYWHYKDYNGSWTRVYTENLDLKRQINTKPVGEAFDSKNKKFAEYFNVKRDSKEEQKIFKKLNLKEKNKLKG